MTEKKIPRRVAEWLGRGGPQVTAREHLAHLVRLYCEARYGVPTLKIDCYDDAGETVLWEDLEALIADFEIWRAAYEVRQQEKVTSCLI